ncbi:MAG TPA: di-heme oxidoredictase family protein [Thermoanaerobaculia bacterium]|nr:di-heme oxidoredictase family protein [Thermoanaerobaculia bacterium]
MRVAAPLALLVAPVLVIAAVTATDAPSGFDNQTNGFEPQANMDSDRALFEQVKQPSDGLGPVYNAQACRECHQNPVSGGIGQIAVLRSGIFDGTTFTEHPGGSIIHDRAVDPLIQERVFAFENVRTLRTTNNALGDGFVEAVDDSTLLAIQGSQQVALRGTAIQVPVLEAPGTTRIGRFGWKDQHASLLSFSADAFLNEMGPTSPLFPTKNTSNGNDVSFFEQIPDPDDPATPTAPFGRQVEAFTRFVRSTKVPPRLPTTDANILAGEQIFSNIGCNICHVVTMTTVPAGTSLNGGTFIVPDALGSKVIHPYSDFLLHDVGTGDGIVQNGGLQTMNMLRTPPLWGLRTRTRLMHDGLNLTINEAIQRHGNQAEQITGIWFLLTHRQKNQLVRFLNTL